MKGEKNTNLQTVVPGSHIHFYCFEREYKSRMNIFILII